MKKIFCVLILLFCFSNVFASGTLMNKFGACSDDDGTGFSFDTFSIEKGKMSELHFANKTDFSFNVGMFSGSAIILLNDNVAKTPESNIKLEGYAAFTPVTGFSIVAGNKTKGKFALDAARLYTTSGVKLAQLNLLPKGFGLYEETNLGDSEFGLKASLGVTPDADFNFFTGLEFRFSKMIYAGIACQFYPLKENDNFLHFSGSLGLHLKDFILTAAYVYNYNNLRTGYTESSDISKIQPYLPALAMHAFKISGQYQISGFTFSADIMAGTKKYLLPGSLKNNPSVSDENKTMSFYGAALLSYQFEKPVSINLKYSVWYLDGVWHSVYPYTEVISGRSSFRAGLRIGIDKNGEVSFAVPLMWTIVFDF